MKQWVIITNKTAKYPVDEITIGILVIEICIKPIFCYYARNVIMMMTSRMVTAYM